jgi:hypothetical protein
MQTRGPCGHGAKTAIHTGRQQQLGGAVSLVDDRVRNFVV